MNFEHRTPSLLLNYLFIIRYSIFVFIFFSLPDTCYSQAIYRDIKNYKVYYASAKRNTQDWLCLRKFESYGKTYLLLADPHELQTKVDEASLYTINQMTMEQARKY